MGFSKKLGVMAVLAGLSIASTALADNEAGMYGNTVVCTYPDGALTKVYLQADGTYTVIRNGQTVQGQWHDDGTNVCYAETNPAPPAGTKDVCVPSKPMKVGDGWTVTDPLGHTCNAVLTAGHQ